MKKAQWASNALSEDRDMFGTVAVIVLVVGLVAAIAFYFDKKRRELWESVARRYGFTYERRDPYDIPSRSARRYFNGNVKDLNNCVQMFPSNLIARTFGFAEAEYFEIEDTRQREAVAVKLNDPPGL
jgi:hypothetical protein